MCLIHYLYFDSLVTAASDAHSFFDVVHTKIQPFVRWNLFQMRCFILLLQFTFNWWDFSTDAFKGVPRPYTSGNFDFKTLKMSSRTYLS